MQTFRAPDGRRLAYEDSGSPAGDGPGNGPGSGPGRGPGSGQAAVLCLAGLTRNSRDFADLADHLAPRFRVVRLDARGRGASERAEDPLSEYTVTVEAGDVLALIDHLALDRVVIVGTSRGGILGVMIAGAKPVLVTALVLNDIGAVIEGPGLLRILATLGREPAAPDFRALARRMQSEKASQFPGVPLARWERHARAICDDRDGRPVLSYDPRLRAAVATAIDEGEPSVTLWPLFEALGPLPVLVLRGANSDILSAGTADAMRARMSGVGVVEIPDRGHVPFLDEPEALAAIDAFLARQAPAPATTPDGQGQGQGLR